jgi:plasmid stabilization system protein ParE
LTRELRSSRPASEEFAEAVRWYEERRRGLGAEFFDAVAATMALIADDPEIGTEVDADELTRRVLVSRFPYQIVYHLTPTEIVIVAVAHLKRRPGYWKYRR